MPEPLTLALGSIATIATAACGWLGKRELVRKNEDTQVTKREDRLLDALETQRADLQRQINAMNVVAAEREQDLRDRVKLAEKRADTLSGKLSAQGEEIDRLRHALVELESQRNEERLEFQRQIGELQDQLAEMRADKEAMEADLRITVDHVAALTDQLRALGQEPQPRPAQPRGANGQFKPYKRKGK